MGTFKCNGGTGGEGHIAILYGSQPCPLCSCLAYIERLEAVAAAGREVHAHHVRAMSTQELLPMLDASSSKLHPALEALDTYRREHGG